MEITLTRDATPYCVFACKKCGQYTYVKTIKKTKKCARCGRNHQVWLIMTNSELVSGITAAVETIKRRQGELAIKELGRAPDLRLPNEFSVVNKCPDFSAVAPETSKKNKNKVKDDEDFTEAFQKVLLKLSRSYSKFPAYLLEMISEEFAIPSAEVQLLTARFLNQGILSATKSDYYELDVEALKLVE